MLLSIIFLKLWKLLIKSEAIFFFKFKQLRIFKYFDFFFKKMIRFEWEISLLLHNFSLIIITSIRNNLRILSTFRLIWEYQVHCR